MRGRRWLVVAVFVSLVAAACGTTSAPSTAPGSASGPAGSQSPLGAFAPRLTDPTAAQLAAADARARIRTELKLAEALGPDGQATLDALDAVELSVINAAFAKVSDVLAGASSSIQLASYVRPAPASGPVSSNPMTTAIISIFLEPMIGKAMDAGKGSFSHTQKETQPASSGPHKEQGTFTWHVGYASGLLQGGFDGSFSSSTGEPPNVKTVSETFSMSFTITPCPDAAGKVNLDLTYEEQTLTAGATENTRADMKATLKAVMNVDDSAELVGTDVTSHIEGSSGKTTSAGASAEGSASMDMSFGLTGGAMGEPNVSGIQAEGDPDAARQSVSMGSLITLFLSTSVDAAAKTARKGWRSDKCVELIEVTPDSKEVSAKEKVDIAATLKHRVTDEELKKKVRATVQGKGTVEPGEADGPKVSYTYTAGESSGDVGTVEIKSVSNRGIATKTLTFSIRGKWTLAVHGSFTQMLGASVGGFSFGAELKVTVDPFPLNVDAGGKVTGTGTIQFSGHPVFPPGTPCTGSYESTETLNVTGSQVTAADGVAKLNLSFSAPPGTVSSTMNCPGGIGGSTQFNMAGGFGGNLTSTLSSAIVLMPAAGGSVSVDETGTSSVWNTRAVLTFELIVAQ